MAMRSAFFFFQAEDGIRDRNVTGVQTCALPISVPGPQPDLLRDIGGSALQKFGTVREQHDGKICRLRSEEIGRASGRERVEIAVVGGAIKKKRGVEERERENVYVRRNEIRSGGW